MLIQCRVFSLYNSVKLLSSQNNCQQSEYTPECKKAKLLKILLNILSDPCWFSFMTTSLRSWMLETLCFTTSWFRMRVNWFRVWKHCFSGHFDYPQLLRVVFLGHYNVGLLLSSLVYREGISWQTSYMHHMPSQTEQQKRKIQFIYPQIKVYSGKDEKLS